MCWRWRCVVRRQCVWVSDSVVNGTVTVRQCVVVNGVVIQCCSAVLAHDPAERVGFGVAVVTGDDADRSLRGHHWIRLIDAMLEHYICRQRHVVDRTVWVRRTVGVLERVVVGVANVGVVAAAAEHGCLRLHGHLADGCGVIGRVFCFLSSSSVDVV